MLYGGERISFIFYFSIEHYIFIQATGILFRHIANALTLWAIFLLLFEMQIEKTPSLLGKRIAATIIDYFIVFGFCFLYVMYFGKEVKPGQYRITGLPALVPIAFWGIYFILAEGLYGATLGHALFYLMVRQVNGSEIDFTHAMKRRFADIFDLHLSLGIVAFILVRQTSLHQRLGDSWAETMVIDKRSFFKTK